LWAPVVLSVGRLLHFYCVFRHGLPICQLFLIILSYCSIPVIYYT
jgi:hypothetical protein